MFLCSTEELVEETAAADSEQTEESEAESEKTQQEEALQEEFAGTCWVGFYVRIPPLSWGQEYSDVILQRLLSLSVLTNCNCWVSVAEDEAEVDELEELIGWW